MQPTTCEASKKKEVNKRQKTTTDQHVLKQDWHDSKKDYPQNVCDHIICHNVGHAVKDVVRFIKLSDGHCQCFQ